MDSKIKNIIFDWGGVLIDVTLDRFLAECKAVGICFEDKEITGTHKTGFFLEYELGNISDDDARNELRRRANKDISDAEIDRIWNTMIDRIPEEKLELLFRLKEKYNLYILSNTNADLPDCEETMQCTPKTQYIRGLRLPLFYIPKPRL